MSQQGNIGGPSNKIFVSASYTVLTCSSFICGTYKVPTRSAWSLLLPQWKAVPGPLGELLWQTANARWTLWQSYCTRILKARALCPWEYKDQWLWNPCVGTADVTKKTRSHCHATVHHYHYGKPFVSKIVIINIQCGLYVPVSIYYHRRGIHHYC